jgi:tetratricopeptide (TPR) repeat protein
MNKFSLKPKKEINKPFIIRAILCFLISSLALFSIFALTQGKLFTFKHFFIFMLCAIPLSVLYALTVEKLGSLLGVTLSGWTTREVPPREQLSADLAKARFCKGKGQFREAIIIINEVLEKDPEFPDALLLKAQILWEGFENRTLALENLDKAMELVKDDDPIHRWALNYYHEIIKDDRIEK